MKKYIISIGLLFLTIGSYAQSKWTLRQCVDYAVENNIELRQQALNVKNSEITLNTSKNSRLPNLNAGASQRFDFGRAISTGTNTPIQESATISSTSFSIGSSVPLFTGFRIPNEIKMNELNLKAAVEGLKKAQENLELQVVSLYLDGLFQKEILKTYQDQLTLSVLQVERTTVLVEAGKVPASQLYDIKAQQAKDELNVTMAQNSLNLSLLNLSQALNLQSNDRFDIEEPGLNDPIENNIASLLPIEQVYRMAIGVKPHVKEAEFNLESSKRNLKIAQSGYYPTLNLNLDYGTGFDRILKSGANKTSISSQLSRNQGKTIGFSLNIPIFNRFETRNRVKSAHLNIENQSLILDNVKLALYKEIQQAYQSATAAQSKYSSTNKALVAAEESFKYAKERYDVGKSTVFELNEAQTKLLSSRSERIQAKYDFIFRAKILDFYQGKEIDIE